MSQQTDRFLAVIALATETVRTEESALRSIARSSHNPDHLIASYIQTRRQWYELVESMLGHTQPQEEEEDEEEIVRTILPQIRINLPPNWDDPVPIRPSAEQVATAMITIPDATELTNCAICQDAVTSRNPVYAVELRACHHQFHTECIHTWWGHSVRCPVCRNDIREGSEDTA